MKKFGFLSHLDLNLYLFRKPIIQALLAKGHQVYAICPKGDKNQALINLGCDVVNYEIDRSGLNPFSEKQSIQNIHDALKDLHLDVLHTFTIKPNIYGTFAAKKAGIPVILNLVEGLGSFYVNNRFKNIFIRTIMEILYKKAFNISNGCVFVNNDDPTYMIKKNIINKSKVKIIKSVGVDTQKFDIQNYSNEDIRKIKQKNHLTNKLIVLMIARAIWDKGLKEFYEASTVIQSKYNNIEFILVGDTDQGNPSCASEEYLKSGNVQWLGHRDDIPELIAICDIFVLPSYREGLPVSLMEAASMSKPIITTDAVGCREVVDNNVNGFLIPIRNPDALAEKIEVLINNEDLRYRMGEQGRTKIFQDFNVNKVVQQYMDYYETFV